MTSRESLLLTIGLILIILAICMAKKDNARWYVYAGILLISPLVLFGLLLLS